MAADYVDGAIPSRRETDVIVGFTIKEMFLEIQNQLGALRGMLAGKADQSDHEALELRVNFLEKAHTAGESIIADYKEEIRPLVIRHETEIQRQDAMRANNKSTWAMAFGSIGACGSIVALFKVLAG